MVKLKPVTYQTGVDVFPGPDNIFGLELDCEIRRILLHHDAHFWIYDSAHDRTLAFYNRVNSLVAGSLML